LGQITQLAGETYVKGSLAYFSQNIFIFNASIRENILFGHVDEPMNVELYQRCLDCCALRHDLTLFPNGDETEIGERGVTLSGGQKARVALARAVYHQGDITLIDDALSAVDGHVAKHMFENAIIGELLTHNRSVIFVTNALQYLKHPRVSKIYVVKEGAIMETGTYADLVSTVDSVFAQMISMMDKTRAENHDVNSLESYSISASIDIDHVKSDHVKSDQSEALEPNIDSKLMSEEIREKGHVGADVYMTWASAAGGILIPSTVVMLFLIFESSSILSSWWLTYWSAHGDSGRSQTYFLAVYGLINFSAAVFDFLRALSVGYFSLLASRKVRSHLT
jgi:ATP-binding cassette, subfamily C (CFTR/MRP), member 1